MKYKMLDEIAGEENDYKRKLLFLRWLKQETAADFIVVGGSALEIYSYGTYLSGDIDIVSADRANIAEKLESAGFIKRGKDWISDKLRLFIEIPSNVLAGSIDKVAVIDIGSGVELKVIGVEDLIIDRLNSCIYWKYKTDCEWAEYLLRRYKENIDINYIKKTAKKEKLLDKLEEMLNADY